MTKIQITKTLSFESLNIRISNSPLHRTPNGGALNFEFRISCWLICCLAGLCSLAGCRQHNYKTEADEKVYSIIDQKWQEDFGTKANYKISDTQSSPDDIQIEIPHQNRRSGANGYSVRAENWRDWILVRDGVLGLPQAVALATAHNRQYQLEKELLYISALDLMLARHEFEPHFFGKAAGGYAKAGGKGLVGFGTGFDPDQAIQEATERRFDPDRLLEEPTGSGFGFGQLLANGAIISTEIAIGWGRILTGDMAGDALASILRTTITKPLLRGSHRRVVMENLTQAERNTLQQLRTFNRFRKTFVVSIISQYYWVLQSFDALKNAGNNYNTLLDIYERVEKLAKAGRLPRFELDRIHQEKLQAHDTLIQAQKQYEQALDEFKITLSLPATAGFRLDENELEALSRAELTMPDYSEVEIIGGALNQRLGLANSADAVADAERKVLVAADGLGPELNLVARAYIPSCEITSDSRGFTDWASALLEMDLPFDRMAEQNLYRKALITLSQKQREYEEAVDMVTLEVRQAYRDLAEAAERHRVQSENLKLARKRLENTLLLLQYGRANSRRVLNAQRDLFDAQNAATEALVNYTIATLNFYRDTGVLQVRPDGMWSH